MVTVTVLELTPPAAVTDRLARQSACVNPVTIGQEMALARV